MNLEPFIDVSIGGKPVNSAFYERLVSATIHDAPGQEADNIDLKFDDEANAVALPTKGAAITVRFGFRDGDQTTSEKMGVFTVEKTGIEGGDGGEFVSVSGRAADMRSDLKEPLSEHFDDVSLGDVVKELAGRHKLGAKVSAELALIKLPYLSRTNQSAMDFLTRLADRYGALFSIKDQKFLFLTPGSFSPLTISKFECESWNFDIEPRPFFGTTEAGWFDRATGKTVIESYSTALKGPSKRVRTVYSSEAEAKAAARAEGDRQARGTGSGSITLAGRPSIMADRPINTVDFRPEANGLWRCAGVDHKFDGTYMTSVSLEAPESGKE